MAKKGKKKDNIFDSFSVWKTVKIVLLLAVGYALGWNFGFVSGQEDGRAQARDSSSNGTSTETSNTDSYGRSPGHPHYGHDHP